jgi:HSP20 family protein
MILGSQQDYIVGESKEKGMTKHEVKVEDTAERMMGRAVIEAMRRSTKAHDMVRKLIGDTIDEIPIERDETPAADLIDLPEEIIAVFNIPGADKSAMELRATEESVYVEAVIPRREGKFLRQERPLVMKRELSVPVEIKPEGVRAKYENGVLEVYLPKLVIVSAQKVNIE